MDIYDSVSEMVNNGFGDYFPVGCKDADVGGNIVTDNVQRIEKYRFFVFICPLINRRKGFDLISSGKFRLLGYDGSDRGFASGLKGFMQIFQKRNDIVGCTEKYNLHIKFLLVPIHR